MRALKVTTVFIAAVIFGGALLAPVGYWAVHALASIMPMPDWLARQPFHRYVSRGMLVLALLGLRPWARGMGLATATNLGWCRPESRHWKLLGRGFVWGFASLAVFAVLAVLAGAKGANFEPSAGEWAKRLFSAALSGLVVAVLCLELKGYQFQATEVEAALRTRALTASEMSEARRTTITLPRRIDSS